MFPNVNGKTICCVCGLKYGHCVHTDCSSWRCTLSITFRSRDRWRRIDTPVDKAPTTNKTPSNVQKFRSSIQATLSQLKCNGTTMGLWIMVERLIDLKKTTFDWFDKMVLIAHFNTHLLVTVSPLLHRNTSLLWVCTQTPWLLLAISKSVNKLHSIYSRYSHKINKNASVPVQGWQSWMISNSSCS